MAESEIEVPTTTTSALATDVIADRHFQQIKLAGGGEGVANELKIEETGRLIAGALLASFFVTGSGIGPGTEYTAGDVIGSPVYVGRAPGGLWSAPQGVTLIELTFGSLSFDAVFLAIPATPDGDAPDPVPGMPNDGDPFSGIGSLLGNAVVFDGETATASKFAPFFSQTTPGQVFTLSDSANPPESTTPVDLYAVFVANDAIAAGDTAPGVAVVLAHTPSSFVPIAYAP